MKKNDYPHLETTSDLPRILALSAMFEKDFSLDWMANLTTSRASFVLGILDELVNTGWLTRKQPGIYAFVKDHKSRESIDHHLTHDERIEYHRRIITLLLSEPLEEDEKAHYLYPHLLKTHNDLIGCDWLKKAGDLFRKSFKTEQAWNCYRKVIEDLSNIKGENADFLYIETAINYSKVSMANQETSQIIAVLDMALKKVGDNGVSTGQKALLKMELAKNEWLRSNYSSAMKYFQEGRALAEKTQNKRILRKTTLFNIYFYFWQGRFKDIINEYESFIPGVTQFPKSRFLLRAVSLAGHSYAQAGQFQQALGMLDALQEYTEEIGDYHTQCYALGNIGMIMLNLRKFEDAARYHKECSELNKHVHNKWLTYITILSRAYFYYITGDYDDADSTLCIFDQLRTQMQVYVSPVPAYFLELCWAMDQGILHHKADYTLAGEIEAALGGNNIFVKGLAYRYAAFMKERVGTPIEEIIKLLMHSVEWLETSGGLFEMAKSQVELAQRLLIANDIPKARSTMMAASGILSDQNAIMIPRELQRLIGEEATTGNIALGEILQLGQDIANIRESRTLVLKIISAVNRLTRAERGAIFFLDEGRLQLKASQNLTQAQIADSDFALSMKTIEEVAQTGRACIREMDAENLFHPFYSAATIRSMICVPMILRDQVTGVLYHDNRFMKSAFNKPDLELLAFFAAQAAISLENVTSYENMESINQRLSQEKAYLEEQYLQRMYWGNILGDSPAIKDVMTRIRKVAKTNSNVLIFGETGVGKELVANAIHRNSLHHDKPLIVVQCSALPESLIESELFGHEKGAFTGAIKRKLGRLELAHGGTLFMDEIGDLTFEVQIRLLRVLQTKRFERVGSNEMLQSDFRLIAATNRDLERAVREGRFRADLYYRLNVFPIYVPSLRERKDDIPLLARHFMTLNTKKMGKDFNEIDKDALDKLMNYEWPGNIRELENTIERAMILNQPPILKVIDLPVVPAPGSRTYYNEPNKEAIALQDNERCHIIWALEQTNWQISGANGAANLLKINPSTLRFRIKKLGIKKL